MLASDVTATPTHPEMNYCQNKAHYVKSEGTERLLHRSDTDEMRACLDEQWRLKGIGPYQKSK
jgi:hypothetical protein